MILKTTLMITETMATATRSEAKKRRHSSNLRIIKLNEGISTLTLDQATIESIPGSRKRCAKYF